MTWSHIPRALAAAAITIATTSAFCVIPNHVRPTIYQHQHRQQRSARLSVSSVGIESWAETTFPEADVSISGASTVAQALEEAWTAICDVIQEPDKCRVVVLPQCSPLEDLEVLQTMYDHLESCQDCCDTFGSEIVLVPHSSTKEGMGGRVALEIKHISGSAGSKEGDDGYNFAPDPMWDDEDDWGSDIAKLAAQAGVEGYDDTESGDISCAYSIPGSDEETIEIMKAWNAAVIAGMGVCPFAVDADRAGLPVAPIHYPVSDGSTAEEVYRDYWHEVNVLLGTDPKVMSTTLLTTPKFGLENVEAFDILTATLTVPLEYLELEKDIQLVFFHPQHTFRDGQARLGSAGAANFARRSPFPMINILRTPQVRLAQRSIPTGLVYQQNEEVLDSVGADALQEMLINRDWTPLEGLKVDRKQAAVDYYRTAQLLQGLDADSVNVSSGDTSAVRKREIEAPAEPLENLQYKNLQSQPGTDFEDDEFGDFDVGDVKTIAGALMKRLLKKKPLDKDIFEEMSGAVDRLVGSRE